MKDGREATEHGIGGECYALFVGLAANAAPFPLGGRRHFDRAVRYLPKVLDIMNTCVFCEIVAGRLDASIVYQDDATLACMDLRQPTAAHLLVMPKQHVETIYDLEPEAAARLMQAAVRVARAVRRAFRPSGLSVWQSNGAAAGQEVPHVHVHLFTREPGDGFLRVYPDPPARPDRPALDQLAEQVRRALAGET